MAADAKRKIDPNSRSLRVALVWNGTVQDERLFVAPNWVTLGGTTGTFPLPDIEGVPTDPLSFLVPSEAGYALHLHPRMGGAVWIKGKRTAVSELLATSPKVELGPADYGVVTFGSLAFFFQYVRSAIEPKRTFMRSDSALAGAVGLSIFCHAALLVMFFIAAQEAPDTRDDELSVDAIRRFMVTPPPKDEEKPPEPEKIEKLEPTKVTEKAPRERVRPAPTPQRDLPKTLRDRLAKIVQERPMATRTESLVQALAHNNTGETQSVTSVLATTTVTNSNTLGNITSTLGTLPGGTVTAQVGGHGPITTTGGPAATKNLTGLAGRAPGAVRGTVRNVSALMRATGGQLDRTTVLGVINRSMGRIQQCYERALTRNAALGGRITFEWTVTATGTVSGAREKDSTLGDAQVSSCILGVVRGMRFPRPQGGAVTIAYPFMFQNAR